MSNLTLINIRFYPELRWIVKRDNIDSIFYVFASKFMDPAYHSMDWGPEHGMYGPVVRYHWLCR